MKKRITCMLLALCMVLAAVPAAVAAPVVEDQETDATDSSAPGGGPN